MLVLIAEAFDFHFGQKAPAGSSPTEAFRAGDGPKALGSPVFGPARRLSSQLFSAFVWGTLAHKVARKRRSIDKLDAEDACIA
jgi:hypothetical protein